MRYRAYGQKGHTMKHIVCTRTDRFTGDVEVTHEYDYYDTPEVETPEMLLRCYHDIDEED